jgi:hypothetical protein
MVARTMLAIEKTDPIKKYGPKFKFQADKEAYKPIIITEIAITKTVNNNPTCNILLTLFFLHVH